MTDRPLFAAYDRMCSTIQIVKPQILKHFRDTNTVSWEILPQYMLDQ